MSTQPKSITWKIVASGLAVISWTVLWAMLVDIRTDQKEMRKDISVLQQDLAAFRGRYDDIPRRHAPIASIDSLFKYDWQ